MSNVWEFDNYTIYEETDQFRFEDNKGNLLGYVSYNEQYEEMKQDLENGADPIEDGWEDGIGNIINIKGW